MHGSMLPQETGTSGEMEKAQGAGSAGCAGRLPVREEIRHVTP